MTLLRLRLALWLAQVAARLCAAPTRPASPGEAPAVPERRSASPVEVEHWPDGDRDFVTWRVNAALRRERERARFAHRVVWEMPREDGA